MQFWNTFAEKHPAAAKWVREGGLFVIVSNLITVFKYLLLQFLPAAFSSLPVVDFGWPGVDVTLFGETFKWNILGYDAAHGGLPYFCAYMIAMVIGECINFPIQRNFVFRSKGNLGKQIAWYVLAFCVITCIVNSINCIWVAVAGLGCAHRAAERQLQARQAEPERDVPVQHAAARAGQDDQRCHQHGHGGRHCHGIAGLLDLGSCAGDL